MLNKVILLFGLDGEEAKTLSAALAAGGFGALAVPPERCGLTLADLLAGRQALATEPVPLPETMAVFHGIPGGELDRVLAILRESGVTVGLKAMTTPTNLRWTPAELCRELAAERKALSRGKRKH